MAMFFLTSVSAFGADKIKNKGVVTLRNGDTLTVKTSEGVFTVTINSDTKIQHPVGLTGIRKKQDTSDVLIPGLKMKFEGEGGGQENQVIKSRELALGAQAPDLVKSAVRGAINIFERLSVECRTFFKVLQWHWALNTPDALRHSSDTACAPKRPA